MYFYYYFWPLNNDRYATTILFRELGVPVVIAVCDFGLDSYCCVMCEVACVYQDLSTGHD